MAIRSDGDAVWAQVGDRASNVTIGKDIRINLPDGEPLDARLARLEVRLGTLEKSHSNVSWALLAIALAIVGQTVWAIQSQANALREISDKLSDTNRRIVRLEALWSADQTHYWQTPTP